MDMLHIYNDWQPFFNQETEKEYFKQIISTIEKERGKYNVYPKDGDIFNAFRLPIADTKVIIIGQDPYHSPNTAIGYAFAVENGKPIPPSLRNICKEVETDLNRATTVHRDLSGWVRQGVFLLNSTLTVREGQPNSHQSLHWDTFTDRAIQELDRDNRSKVFMLWGAFAKKKKSLIQNPEHLILEAAHPSPLSAGKGFFGCKHFSQANMFLEGIGQRGIEW